VDNTFEIQWVIKPEAGLMAIIKRAKEDIKNLRMKDVVVVWGGPKGVEQN
jgi:ribulose 1,5-bisphosphate synthetase/thiazole synthase